MSEQQEESCVVCESKGHRTTECPTIPAFKEVLMAKLLIQVMLEIHFQTK